MKKIIFIIGWFLSFVVIAQEKLSTKNGQVTFEASVPSFEEIKATTKTASCIINTVNGEFASLILIKSFRFKVALMEEHFNENYLESDNFPKATLKGKLLNFEVKKLTENFQIFTLDGKLDMHGNIVLVKIPVKIKKIKDSIEISANFKVNTTDFDIKIPAAVSKKVAKEVDVAVNYSLN
jgi:polyisoprenoid-binding protein YceI